jgi:hypothetical protein
LAWLVDTLSSDPDIGLADSVELTEGANTDPARAIVWIGDVKSEEGWAALGAMSRDERYVIEMGCAVGFAGDSASDARTRVFALAQRVFTVLRADPRLGGGGASPGVIVAELGTQSYSAPVPLDEGGFTASVDFAIRVRSRI